MSADAVCCQFLRHFIEWCASNEAPTYRFLSQHRQAKCIKCVDNVKGTLRQRKRILRSLSPTVVLSTQIKRCFITSTRAVACALRAKDHLEVSDAVLSALRRQIHLWAPVSLLPLTASLGRMHYGGRAQDAIVHKDAVLFWRCHSFSRGRVQCCRRARGK